MEAKRGMRFVHTRALGTNNEPLVMRVTAIRQGVIYYKCDDGKGSWYVAKDRFPDIVKEVLQPCRNGGAQ